MIKLLSAYIFPSNQELKMTNDFGSDLVLLARRPRKISRRKILLGTIKQQLHFEVKMHFEKKRTH